MGQPAKKIEYRLMTLAELRQEADRRLYQANKLRAEYESKARQKAQEAAAWARRTGAKIETGARQVQQQVRSGTQQTAQAAQAGARVVGQAVERGVAQGAARAVQQGQRLQRGAAATVHKSVAAAGSRIDEPFLAAKIPWGIGSSQMPTSSWFSAGP